MTMLNDVWVFNGESSRFPSGIFQLQEEAVAWITRHGLTGTLTKYPLGISVYDWAIETGSFKVRSSKDEQAEFIGKFSSAAQEHLHFENGAAA